MPETLVLAVAEEEIDAAAGVVALPDGAAPAPEALTVGVTDPVWLGLRVAEGLPVTLTVPLLVAVPLVDAPLLPVFVGVGSTLLEGLLLGVGRRDGTLPSQPTANTVRFATGSGGGVPLAVGVTEGDALLEPLRDALPVTDDVSDGDPDDDAPADLLAVGLTGVPVPEVDCVGKGLRVRVTVGVPVDTGDTVLAGVRLGVGVPVFVAVRVPVSDRVGDRVGVPVGDARSGVPVLEGVPAGVPDELAPALGVGFALRLIDTVLDRVPVLDAVLVAVLLSVTGGVLVTESVMGGVREGVTVRLGEMKRGDSVRDGVPVSFGVTGGVSVLLGVGGILPVLLCVVVPVGEPVGDAVRLGVGATLSIIATVVGPDHPATFAIIMPALPGSDW